MSKIKYGWAYGGKKGVEMPVTADQYFHQQGGHFVVASAATGYATLADKTDTVLKGFAEVPKNADLKSSWKSSSTSGADSVFVITDPTAVYAMPMRTTASIAQAIVSSQLDIGQNGATYSIIQYVDGASAKDVLIVDKVDAVNDIIYVRINPAKQG